MKKNFFIFCLGVALCATTLNAQTFELAIMEASVKISRDLPSGASVAVINFRSDSESLNEYALNELYGAILRNRNVIPVRLNPSQFQTIRGELNASGGLKKESAQSIGKLLGAQYLITGAIEQNGALYNVVFNAFDLNAEIQSQYQASINSRNDKDFAAFFNSKSPTSTVSASQPGLVTISAIAGVKPPVAGETPVKSITENFQYTGTVTWYPEVSGNFKTNTQYTATITLTPKTGYILENVAADFFKIAGAIANNNENSGIVTAAFPVTESKYLKDAKLWSIGVSMDAYSPNVYFDGGAVTIYGTLAPFNYSFLELGMDLSWGWRDRGSHDDWDSPYDSDYFCLYPFANYALFIPFARTKSGKRGGGFYLGGGFSLRFERYTFEAIGPIPVWGDPILMTNIIIGFNILDVFNISGTSRFGMDIDDFFWEPKLLLGLRLRFK